MPLDGKQRGRRPFLQKLMVLGGLAAAPAGAQAQQARRETGPGYLPGYVRAQNYRSLKQSSFDRTGATPTAGPFRRARPWRSFRPKVWA